MGGKENKLREKWNTINYYSGGALKLSVKHPLEWYVRYATPEHKSVVIVSQKAIKKIDSSKCIDASCNQRKDGKYAISFTLMDQKQEDVFITMAGDIIEYSNVETDDIALLKVLRRYNAWLKLLDRESADASGIRPDYKRCPAHCRAAAERRRKAPAPSSGRAGRAA